MYMNAFMNWELGRRQFYQTLRIKNIADDFENYEAKGTHVKLSCN